MIGFELGHSLQLMFANLRTGENQIAYRRVFLHMAKGDRSEAKKFASDLDNWETTGKPLIGHVTRPGCLKVG